MDVCYLATRISRAAWRGCRQSTWQPVVGHRRPRPPVIATLVLQQAAQLRCQLGCMRTMATHPVQLHAQVAAPSTARPSAEVLTMLRKLQSHVREARPGTRHWAATEIAKTFEDATALVARLVGSSRQCEAMPIAAQLCGRLAEPTAACASAHARDHGGRPHLVLDRATSAWIRTCCDLHASCTHSTKPTEGCTQLEELVAAVTEMHAQVAEARRPPHVPPVLPHTCTLSPTVETLFRSACHAQVEGRPSHDACRDKNNLRWPAARLLLSAHRASTLGWQHLVSAREVECLAASLRNGLAANRGAVLDMPTVARIAGAVAHLLFLPGVRSVGTHAETSASASIAGHADARVSGRAVELARWLLATLGEHVASWRTSVGVGGVDDESLGRLRVVAWAFAKVGCVHHGAVSTLASITCDTIEEVGAMTDAHLGDVALLMWALAQLRLDLVDEVLLQRTMRAACTSVATMYPGPHKRRRATLEWEKRQADVRLVLWAAAMTGQVAHPLFDVACSVESSSAQCHDVSQVASAQWEQIGVCMMLDGRGQSQGEGRDSESVRTRYAMVLHSLTQWVAKRAHTSPLLLNSYRGALAQARWRYHTSWSAVAASSQLHRRVVEALRRAGVAHRCEVTTEDVGYSVDVQCWARNDRLQRSLPAPDADTTDITDVAVEVNGPDHYLLWCGVPAEVVTPTGMYRGRRSAKPVGATQARLPPKPVPDAVEHRGSVLVPSLSTSVKRRHLEACGWCVVHVPFSLWPALGTKASDATPADLRQHYSREDDMLRHCFARMGVSTP